MRPALLALGYAVAAAWLTAVLAHERAHLAGRHHLLPGTGSHWPP
jgi:Zn-dependent protease with chaperone function